jgi:hypothetical protein
MQQKHLVTRPDLPSPSPPAFVLRLPAGLFALLRGALFMGGDLPPALPVGDF